MINGLVFNQAFWIKRTPEIANKLNNCDSLNTFKQNVISSMNHAINAKNIYKEHHGQKSGTYYKEAVITIDDNGYITFE